MAAQPNTRTTVRKHERGPVRILVTVLGIFGIIGGSLMLVMGGVTGSPALFGMGGFALVFWVIMVIIARPKEEIITETVYNDENNNTEQGVWSN